MPGPQIAINTHLWVHALPYDLPHALSRQLGTSPKSDPSTNDLPIFLIRDAYNCGFEYGRVRCQRVLNLHGEQVLPPSNDDILNRSAVMFINHLVGYTP